MTEAKLLKLRPGWWREEREPTEAKKLIVRKERKIRTVSDLPQLLTVREVALKIRRNVDFVYDLIKSKQLDYQPIGQRYMVPVDALADYLERERIKAG